jgi:hypothetical protein
MKLNNKFSEHLLIKLRIQAGLGKQLRDQVNFLVIDQLRIGVPMFSGSEYPLLFKISNKLGIMRL